MGHEVFEYDRGSLPRSLATFAFDDAYRCPLLQAAPVLDGRVRAEQWAVAAAFDGLSHKGVLEERRAKVYVAATRTHLYVAVVSELPRGLPPVADVTAHSDLLVFDDAIELWIDPTPGSDNGVAYQMLANFSGVDAYLTHPRGSHPPQQLYGWKGNYRLASGIHDGYWHCQIEVPLSAVAGDRPSTEGVWGINVCRDFKRPWGFASLGNRGFAPGGEIVFRFCDSAAAAVQLDHRSDPTTRRIDTALSLLNPGSDPLPLTAHLFLKRDKMPEAAAAESLILPPGANHELLLRLEDGVSDVFELFVLVEGAGGDVHYSRYYRWGPPRPARWDADIVPRPAVDFRFAYYPYLNLMRLKVDPSGLDPAAVLDAVEFTIGRKNDRTVVHETRFVAADLAAGKLEQSFTLPPLDGEYDITARCVGRGVPSEPRVQSFHRTRHEWEHAKVGTSRTVYPPFTPIQVQGMTLKTVLKEYDLGDCGLLDQVRSDDQQRLGMKPILAGPMRYAATVDGAATPVMSDFVRLVSQEDDRVVAEGACVAGAAPLRWTSTLEYDGMLRVDLTLQPSAGHTLDALDLEIPLHGSVAQLLHAMADGIRYPIRTAAVSAGEGVVWSASSLVSSDYPPNFATYVFLGNGSRGLCWFAENDRGWSWNPSTPNVEIIRKGPRVTLVVHLVNVPVVVDQPRTITFGLQASPTKPYTPGWRYRWEAEQFSVIGTDIHWFGLGNCASVYPAGKDLSLWETLRKSTLEPLSDAEIEQTIARAKVHFAARGDAAVELMEILARKNLRSRLGKKIILYYNRSAYPAEEEFQTFMDEWCTGDFNPYHGSAEHHEVKIVPSESYIDFVLHWYVKSFEHSPNVGVYVDNIFFYPTRNPVLSGAYRRGDGSVMPSTGVWQLRQLAKRTFVMLNERGLEPLHMVHLTSALILPIVSFYTIQYDWEWHFSEGDVQDRFPREYLLAVSSGAHNGAWPVVLHEQGRCVADAWTLRTYLAVSTVHELIVDPYVWDVEVIPTGDTAENRLFDTLRRPILELCRQPGLQVWRYWDDRPQPVQTGHPLLLAIVYAVPGREAIVALCSYAEQDVSATVTIDPAPLGFVEGYGVTDVETGEAIATVANAFTLHVKRHDLRELRLRPSLKMP